MIICLVCREFPPESGVSGTGTYMHSIAKGLERLGHQITVVSYSRSGETQTTDGNITVYRIRPKTFKGSGRLQKWAPVWFLNYSFAVYKKLVQLNRQLRFDIIQIPEWGGEGFFFARRPFCPFVVKVHGPLFLNHRFDRNHKTRILKYLENWMEKSVVKRADAVIYSSRAMQNLTRETWKLKRNNSVVIENPIDLNAFHPKKTASDGAERTPTVLYVGRLEYRKGIHVLYRAIPLVMNKNPDVRFVIIGSDTRTGDKGRSILSETKEFLERKDLLHGVTFIGPQKRADLVDYYRRCDIFVMPSLFEPVGFTAIEAMACGKPVVVSSNAGIAERIEDGLSGYLIEPGSASALAEKINFILELNQKQREKIGAAARGAVNPLSFENIGRELENLYKDIIGR